MLKNIILLLTGVAVASFISACSSKSHHTQHEYLGHIPSLKEVDAERNEYEHKHLTAIPVVKNIGEATLYNTAELKKHIPGLKKNIIVTSIVDVDNFTQSSDFGRLYSDSMITNFKRAGWNVIDFRGKNILGITKEGEFYLNRNALKSTPKDSVVFVGTYGHYNKNGLLINVRLLNKASNYVLSASNVQLNDATSYKLSKKSNCLGLTCAKKKMKEPAFNIMVIEDDCKNSSRCECSNPNKCLGEKEI